MAANAPASSSRRYLPHAIWAAIVIVPFLFVLISVLVTELGPDQCGGVRWGCELAGADGAGIVLIFFGIPALMILLVGHLVIGLAQWLRGRSSPVEHS